MAHLKDARKELIDQLIFVLDHSMTLKKDGVDPMIPFSVMVKGDDKVIKTFVGDTPEYAEKMFEKTIREEDPEIAMFATDTYLTIEGAKSDGILIKAYDQRDNYIYLVGQRFIPKSTERDFEKIGNPAFLGTMENHFKTGGKNTPETPEKKSKWKFW